MMPAASSKRASRLRERPRRAPCLTSSLAAADCFAVPMQSIVYARRGFQNEVRNDVTRASSTKMRTKYNLTY
eukprot:5345971-Amphidinium_carterae.1